MWAASGQSRQQNTKRQVQISLEYNITVVHIYIMYIDKYCVRAYSRRIYYMYIIYFIILYKSAHNRRDEARERLLRRRDHVRPRILLSVERKKNSKYGRISLRQKIKTARFTF